MSPTLHLLLARHRFAVRGLPIHDLKEFEVATASFTRKELVQVIVLLATENHKLEQGKVTRVTQRMTTVVQKTVKVVRPQKVKAEKDGESSSLRKRLQQISSKNEEELMRSIRAKFTSKHT